MPPSLRGRLDLVDPSWHKYVLIDVLLFAHEAVQEQEEVF
jgi:hypothetical protein